jgi:hypothetical protein
MFLEKPRAAERWYRGGKWKAKAMHKNDLCYSYYHSMENTERISKFKYRFIKEGTSEEEYDPFTDTPGAYLRFARLGDYERLHWDERKLLNEIVKFLNDFGPPWLDDIEPSFSLIVEKILYHACIMASTVRVYNLLTKIRNYNQPINPLREILIDISRTDPNPIIPDIMYKLGIKRYNDNDAQILIPYRPSDQEVIMIGEKYVEERVQIAMAEDPVSLAIVLETTKIPGEKPTRGFIPEYIFVNLLPVLWFQLFLDIVNDSVLKECANATCGRFFVPQRSDQIYCTTYCRNTSNVLKNYYSKKTIRKEENSERPHREEK